MASAEIRDVILRGDRAAFGELLDPAVVWVGVYPGQLCRSREDVLAMFDEPRTVAKSGEPRNAARKVAPEIVEERGNVVVVDPHPDPPPEWAPDICQVIVVREGKVVEMRDYPDRAAALEAARGVP
jgi:ketosteroid isomerase-like protein